MNLRVNDPPTLETRSQPSENANAPGIGSAATYVQQECPVCGRPLLILVQHLGQRVTCMQCRCAFVCYDPSQRPGDGEQSGDSLLDRAERLLALLEARARTRSHALSVMHHDRHDDLDRSH